MVDYDKALNHPLIQVINQLFRISHAVEFDKTPPGLLGISRSRKQVVVIQRNNRIHSLFMILLFQILFRLSPVFYDPGDFLISVPQCCLQCLQTLLHIPLLLISGKDADTQFFFF